MSGPLLIDRRTMSTGRMWLFSTNASGPLVVLIGGIPTTYAVTRVAGVPLAFVEVTAVLALLSVGYTAMARHVPHAAVYYAAVSRGLGRPLGVAAGMLALVAYNAILTCMYGFLGGFLAGTFGGAWWVWAYLAWGCIAAAGVRPVIVSAWLLGFTLAISALIIAAFVIAALAHPAAGHVTVQGYSWHALPLAGLSGAVTMCVAGLMGFEGAPSFSTEAVDPAGPSRAVVRSVWTLGLVYSVIAWAMGVTNGPDQVAAVAADPSVGVPLNTLVDAYGFLITPATDLAVVFGVLATMLSVHAIVARYAYAIARERVLPQAVAFVGSGELAGGPVGGSRLQSGIGLIVITWFAAWGADPLTTLFPWFATVGALGLVLLLLFASLAALVYLRGRRENLWVRLIAPGLGLLSGGVLFTLMVRHSDVLLGVGPTSSVPVVIPVVVAAIVVAGMGWAWYLAAERPHIYEGIGHGIPEPLDVVSRRLATHI